MSYHITSYHIISYHIISYHIISYHIISYHAISYHIISYHIISYHIISYHIISYHIISYHIISYHIISYHIISYCSILHHILLQMIVARASLSDLAVEVVALAQVFADLKQAAFFGGVAVSASQEGLLAGAARGPTPAHPAVLGMASRQAWNLRGQPAVRISTGIQPPDVFSVPTCQPGLSHQEAGVTNTADAQKESSASRTCSS